MSKKKRLTYGLALIPLLIILAFFTWILTFAFEGEKPDITLKPQPAFLSQSQTFQLDVGDQKRGLKRVKVSVSQEGREITVFEKKFPFEGLFNRRGVHHFEKEISINPTPLNLAQGRVDLNVHVWDYSRRGGGDGNLNLTSHRMTVDTIPPALRAVSRMHNVNPGGTGLAVYQTSSDTVESGVFVDKKFFGGYPAGTNAKKGYRVCYFALPYNSRSGLSINLWAKDKAGNVSTRKFYYHIRRKRFRNQRLNINDRFLSKVLPYFSFYSLNPQDSDINKYVKINNELRKESHGALRKLKEQTVPEKLWDGPWLRLNKAATMARFADRRSYYYQGKKVDEQIHLGVDLASLKQSPVQAANRGRVLLAERFGIYGLTVIIDHGQGLTSMYGHLSHIDVVPGQEVAKGEIIGKTGQTGLAGGDHLHFSILTNGEFVNPIEWWDAHWIRDNVTKKLALMD